MRTLEPPILDVRIIGTGQVSRCRQILLRCSFASTSRPPLTAHCAAVVTSQQIDLSRAFSGHLRGEDRFEIGDWQSNDEAPALHIPWSVRSRRKGWPEQVRELVEPLIYQDGVGDEESGAARGCNALNGACAAVSCARFKSTFDQRSDTSSLKRKPVFIEISTAGVRWSP